MRAGYRNGNAGCLNMENVTRQRTCGALVRMRIDYTVLSGVEMSLQSDAAKKHIEVLLETTYPGSWIPEYKFCPTRRWRFDYAVPCEMCAIELDGGLFINGAHSNPAAIKKNYEKMNQAALQGWRVWHYTPEQVIKAGRKGTGGFFIPPHSNIFSPPVCETLPDESILICLPWLEDVKHTKQSVIS